MHDLQGRVYVQYPYSNELIGFVRWDKTNPKYVEVIGLSA